MRRIFTGGESGWRKRDVFKTKADAQAAASSTQSSNLEGFYEWNQSGLGAFPISASFS